MRRVLYIALGLGLACTSVAYAVDDLVVSPVPASPEVAAPVTPVERPKPIEKPRPIERPKPIEKPRVEPENTGLISNPTPPVPAKAVETGTPVLVNAPSTSSGRSNYVFGCLGMAFAMLILGIGAGFLGRHLMSRHKLGGMTVRIGTWRGIP